MRLVSKKNLTPRKCALASSPGLSSNTERDFCMDAALLKHDATTTICGSCRPLETDGNHRQGKFPRFAAQSKSRTIKEVIWKVTKYASLTAPLHLLSYSLSAKVCPVPAYRLHTALPPRFVSKSIAKKVNRRRSKVAVRNFVFGRTLDSLI